MCLFFECLCVRDLRVYAESLDVGGDKLIEEGAGNLKKFCTKIDPDKMKEPSFMMVLTGAGKYAYRRVDGVYVVPVGCLREQESHCSCHGRAVLFAISTPADLQLLLYDCVHLVLYGVVKGGRAGMKKRAAGMTPNVSTRRSREGPAFFLSACPVERHSG